jgi:hypothetical protein
MMDRDAIDLVLHEIQCMVSVAISAAENLSGSDTDPDICQMPYEKHNLLDFSLFDIEKRLKALRAALGGAA